MAFIWDEVFDGGLDFADTWGTVTVWVCTSDPGSSSGPVTAQVGSKTGLNIDTPGDAVGGGRSVQTTPTISDGNITAAGTVTHWSITNSANTQCLASGELAASASVASGNTFSLDPIEIFIRDATSV
jgi:hypothetical protein